MVRDYIINGKVVVGKVEVKASIVYSSAFKGVGKQW